MKPNLQFPKRFIQYSLAWVCCLFSLTSKAQKVDYESFNSFPSLVLNTLDLNENSNLLLNGNKLSFIRKNFIHDSLVNFQWVNMDLANPSTSMKISDLNIPENAVNYMLKYNSSIRHNYSDKHLIIVIHDWVIIFDRLDTTLDIKFNKMIDGLLSSEYVYFDDKKGVIYAGGLIQERFNQTGGIKLMSYKLSNNKIKEKLICEGVGICSYVRSHYNIYSMNNDKNVYFLDPIKNELLKYTLNQKKVGVVSIGKSNENAFKNFNFNNLLLKYSGRVQLFDSIEKFLISTTQIVQFNAQNDSLFYTYKDISSDTIKAKLLIKSKESKLTLTDLQKQVFWGSRILLGQNNKLYMLNPLGRINYFETSISSLNSNQLVRLKTPHLGIYTFKIKN